MQPPTDQLTSAPDVTDSRETPAGGLHQRMVRRRASDKSVKAAAVNVKLVQGQIVVENKLNGVLFSFPAAVWPDSTMSAHQRMWIERLTPWWDMEQPQWSPTSQRLRESCVKAINNLLVPLPLKPETTNGGMGEKLTRRTGVKSAHCERCVESLNAALCRPGVGAGDAHNNFEL